jgi:hypothetical protein
MLSSQWQVKMKRGQFEVGRVEDLSSRRLETPVCQRKQLPVIGVRPGGAISNFVFIAKKPEVHFSSRAYCISFRVHLFCFFSRKRIERRLWTAEPRFVHDGHDDIHNYFDGNCDDYFRIHFDWYYVYIFRYYLHYIRHDFYLQLLQSHDEIHDNRNDGYINWYYCHAHGDHSELHVHNSRDYHNRNHNVNLHYFLNVESHADNKQAHLYSFSPSTGFFYSVYGSCEGKESGSAYRHRGLCHSWLG